MNSNFQRALPNSGLLRSDDSSRLAFQDRPWRRLGGYVQDVEAIVAHFDGDVSGRLEPALGESLGRLDGVVRHFGSPRRLRRLLRENPECLAAAVPPTDLYAHLVWLVQRWHESASNIVSRLRHMVSASSSSSELRQGLRTFGREAEGLRRHTSVLTDRFRAFEPDLLQADAAFVHGMELQTHRLREVQGAIGGRRVEIESLEARMADLGILHRTRKQTMQRALTEKRRQLEESVRQGDVLRRDVQRLESLLESGPWLAQGCEGVIEALDIAHSLWTTFGSACAQLAVDATGTQLEDSDALKTALGFDSAVEAWGTIDRATQGFVADALVDFSND